MIFKSTFFNLFELFLVNSSYVTTQITGKITDVITNLALNWFLCLMNKSICFFRATELLESNWHMEHLNGFSPSRRTLNVADQFEGVGK